MTMSSLQGDLTDNEFVCLRLKCWDTLAGWGVRQDPDEKNPLKQIVEPWNVAERQRHADILLEWLLSPFPPNEEEDEVCGVALMAKR